MATNNIDKDKRKSLIDSLKSKDWFKKSSTNTKKQLLELSSEFDGFLLDLVTRPEIIGNIEVIKLDKLLVGNYLITPVFQVRSLLTNEIYTYEYSSWKYGKHTGYKGILLVEIDGKIKFFITRKAIKFPTANVSYEAIGSFEPDLSENKLVNLSKSVKKQLKKLLGINDIYFKRYIDLGLFSPDSGLSNQSVVLFAGIINLDNAQSIEKHFDKDNVFKRDPGYDVEIHPIERLTEYTLKSEDGYFLACVSKLLAKNIITL